jgi:hypothetical protein
MIKDDEEHRVASVVIMLSIKCITGSDNLYHTLKTITNFTIYPPEQ